MSGGRPTYLWENLEAATEYTFHVYACNKYTLECGEPSKAVKGTTSDGKSGPPSNVVAKCKFDNISDMNFVEVEWAIPQKPNGLIEFYNVSAHNQSFRMNATTLSLYLLCVRASKNVILFLNN